MPTRVENKTVAIEWPPDAAPATIDLSYVIVSYNRREALLANIERLKRSTPLPAGRFDIWVVDNASTDGSADAVAQLHPDVKLIRNAANEGMAARNHAFDRLTGEFIVLLDDDSYPLGNAVARSIEHLRHHPRTAAVVGRVVLPDGGLEGPAMPAVMLGGASCVRKSVIDEVGGFPPEFFRQAEEYDLSFRIWNAGYRIERFEDIVYMHDKLPTNRPSALTQRMDLRNNLILVERYLPRAYRSVYRHDWLRRYAALAAGAGCEAEVGPAIREARQWAARERRAGRSVVSDTALEAMFAWDSIQQRVREWAERHRVRRVLIASYAKNIFAIWRACRAAGLEVAAVVDNNPAFGGMTYRGAPIVTDEQAAACAAHGVVVANINPAQQDGRAKEVRRWFKGPVLTLWRPAEST